MPTTHNPRRLSRFVHPDDTLIAAFLDGTTTPVEDDLLLSHFDQCGSCFQSAAHSPHVLSPAEFDVILHRAALRAAQPHPQPIPVAARLVILFLLGLASSFAAVSLLLWLFRQARSFLAPL